MSIRSIRVTYHFGEHRPPVVEVVEVQSVAEAATMVAERLSDPKGFHIVDQSAPPRGVQFILGSEVHGFHLRREHAEMGHGAGTPGLLTDASEQKVEWLRSVARHEHEHEAIPEPVASERERETATEGVPVKSPVESLAESLDLAA